MVEPSLAILIVKENPPNTAHFLTMLEEKIFITPRLENRVIVRVMLIAGILHRLMEMDHILSKGIVGG